MFPFIPNNKDEAFSLFTIPRCQQQVGWESMQFLMWISNSSKCDFESNWCWWSQFRQHHSLVHSSRCWQKCYSFHCFRACLGSSVDLGKHHHYFCSCGYVSCTLDEVFRGDDRLEVLLYFGSICIPGSGKQLVLHWFLFDMCSYIPRINTNPWVLTNFHFCVHV